ncbi:Slr0569 protein [Candidatus Vecturithrix granuli]|uniref:Slr0569 protein n=1 Tax=Vecturithrix granuli TaxID=1499967 RepID=A0A081C3Y3_VECG1|nr:Slr0569 protein [Candidatus Vecturithrix granuli]
MSLLTKSKYLNGLQCIKRLWVEEKHPERIESSSKAQQRIMNQGIEVGIYARENFFDGIVIERGRNAIEDTQTAVNGDNSCIFEATFIFDGVEIRCDVLQKNDLNSWNIIEVKSSTSVKDEYLPDLAIQKYVLTGLGVEIKQVKLMYINNQDCISPNLSNLFTCRDITSEVDELITKISNNIREFREVLDQDIEPNILIGKHCDKPHKCPIKNYCWRDVPEKSIFTIPRLDKRKEQDLISKGILSISEIPPEYPLSEKQWTYIDTVINAKPEINRDAIKSALSKIEYPIHFLDFESFNPAIPRFDGMRPYEHFPFQYSCHKLLLDRTIIHYEYLHTDTSDPRLPLLESLLTNISGKGSIIVYKKSFEKGILENLSKIFPQYSVELESMISRLWDQLAIFQNYYTHPDFDGKISLKSVLPILVPSLGYKSLEIQKGDDAGTIWDLMIHTPDEMEKDQMIKDLKAYCKMDTFATAKIHEVLSEF